jgi:ABC-type transport system involved in multi-copper enzyme maturation permease subunit
VRILGATIRKLLRRPATWVTLILLNVFTLLIVLAIGASARSGEAEAEAAARTFFTFPAAYRFMIAFVFMNGLLAAAFGAAIAGSEWSWGTLKAAVARGESRSIYVLATFAGVAVVLILGALVSVVIGIPAALLGAVLGGLPTTGAGDTAWLGDLPAILGRGTLAFTMDCALGFAIATITRSQIAGGSGS